MADLFDVIGSQRACRRFHDAPVPDDLVERVLWAATHAPSAENRQPWEFVVIRGAERRAAIGELTRQVWRDGARAATESRLTPELLADVDQGASGGVASAPVLVVVCGDTQAGHPAALGASIYPATQNLLLAAAGLGLGAALTTLPVARPGALAALLELPTHVVPMAVIPLGWPAAPLGPPRRRPFAERAHREVYGAGW